MKVAYIVDSLTDFTKKIDLISNKFGRNNIYFIVRADLMPFFETFSYTAHAVYYKKLSTVLHLLLQNTKRDDLIIYNASLHLTENLLNKFIRNIKDGSKIVSLSPTYSRFETMVNSLYNKYVQSLFNIEDSLVSSKLQFIPAAFVNELLKSHISNRLFSLNPEISASFTSDHPLVNKTSKSTYSKLKLNLIFSISFLVITMLFMLSIAYLKIKILGCFIFAILIILNTVIYCISHFKKRFDSRFLK